MGSWYAVQSMKGKAKMRKWFRSIWLLVMLVGFMTSSGCITIATTRCPRPSRPYPVSHATDKVMQQRLSLYFSAMVNQKMVEAAKKGLWSEDAMQWGIRCPWESVGGGGDDPYPYPCPCGKPLCCCPTQLVFDEFIRLLMRDLHVGDPAVD